MKNIFSLKKSVAALSLLMACGVSAQNATFEKFMTSKPAEGEEPTLPYAHRTRPAVGDYNNDDRLDIFYGGQNPNDFEEKFGTGGWNCQAVLVKNNADGTFTVSIKVKTEAGTEENPDVAGSPSEDLANFPVNTSSFFRFLDFNNDGNLDLIIRGQGNANDRFDVPEYLLLLKNLGPDHDYKFEVVENHGIIQASNEGFYEGISVGDYDKDGFVDVVVTGYTGDINPPTIKDENDNEIPNEQYNPELPSRKGGRYVDLYKNNNGEGTFSLQNIVSASRDGDWEGRFKPMSHSNVLFADLDNDGWLDIVYTGYADNTEDMPRDADKDIRIYRNVDEGTAFLDVTPLENAEFRGGSESTIYIEDMNGDGKLDIVQMGDGAPGHTSIYINNGDFEFTVLNNDDITLLPTRAFANATFVDMNHDGTLDYVVAGWCDKTEGGVAYGVMYQSAEGKYNLDNYLFIKDEPRNGGILAADFFNRGKIDVFQVAYNFTQEVAIFKNTSDVVNAAPSAPTNVKAEIKDEMLTVTWEDATDDATPVSALFYNIYVKDNKTGEIFMIIPANPATGRLKVITDYQNGVRSGIGSYSMYVDTTEGYSYTVGVQAIDQAQAGSMFATANLGVTSVGENAADNVIIETVEGGFVVKSVNNTAVEVVDMCGRLVKAAQTNEVITVTKGIYLITVEGKTYKVIR